ncbi:hypothetical protein E4U52_000801 [Claviceps spartinae]|nr:hypothetical protein E4U52_000801 [Claviceps spartinae]
MLKDGVTDQLKTNHLNFLQTLHRTDPLVSDFQGIQKVYEGIHGYAGHFSDSVIEQLRTLPEVDYIERDQIVRTQEFTIQKSATWGLARISHRPRLTFGTFTKYLYDDVAGEGVDVYVVDTGINIDHVEFEGRASWGKTVPQNDIDEDGNGHGSHCAGTIASRKYGVAKKANVIAIKVLGTNGSGTMSDVIDGVLWAAQQAAKKAAAADAEFAATGRTSHKGSVANMSLGGGKSQALDTAVNKAVLSGLHFAVAAGNDNRDACNYSPASAENAITVGASTLGDERAYFSNWGACVDVFAPGLNILSTYKGSRTATSTLSGTSMASPHTAGLLAYLLSIYPHASFDPTFDAEENLISLTNDKLLSKTTSIYALAHARTATSTLSGTSMASPLSFTNPTLIFIMRFATVIAAVACAAFVAAQTPSECVMTCVQTAMEANGCEGLSDTACLCGNEAFQTATQECLAADCTPEDLTAALALQETLCAAAPSDGAEPSAPAPSDGAEPSGGAEPSASDASGSSSGSPRPTASGTDDADDAEETDEPDSASMIKAAWAPVAVAAVAALAL